MRKRTILGAQILNRTATAAEVQKVLTEFGCSIKTRLGLHEVTDRACATAGLLLLETFGSAESVKLLEERLKGIKGLVVKKMVFME